MLIQWKRGEEQSTDSPFATLFLDWNFFGDNVKVKKKNAHDAWEGGHVGGDHPPRFG